MKKTAFILISIMLMSLGVWVTFDKFEHPPPGIDDAQIYFVYAQNIVDGEGIVFNPGGERVEGFTSVLWMILVSLLFLFTDQPENWLLLLSILITAAANAYLWFFISRGELLSWRSFLFLAWVFGAPGYVVWMSLPLMDIALWSAILILTTVTVIKAESSLQVGILISLVLLTRPEGIVWGLMFLFVYSSGVISKEGLKGASRKVRLPLLFYVLTMISLIAVRLAYFGYPFPNTYYAKIGPDVVYNLAQGTLYLVNFMASNVFPLTLVIGAAIAGAVLNLPNFLRNLRSAPFTAEDNIQTENMNVSLIALTGLLVPVLIGGDHFSMYRFYQPIWPLLILPVLAMLGAISTPIPRVIRNCALVGALLILVLTPWYRWDNLSFSWLRIEFGVAKNGVTLGNTLNLIFENDPPSVGYGFAGAFAYVYNGQMVDIFGLNNVAMAHSPGDRRGLKNHAAFNTDIFLSQQPDLFLPTICSRDTIAGSSRPIEFTYFLALDGIFEDQRFLDLYVFTSLVDSENCLLAWVKKSYVVELINQGYSTEEIDYRLVIEEHS